MEFRHSKIICLWVCIMTIIVPVIQQSLPCKQYLGYLATMMQTNHEKFKSEIGPYLLYSGKGIDDLGYPDSCLGSSANYSYTTVQLRYASNNITYLGYMGLCFSKSCTASDLNIGGDFIIDYILSDYDYNFESNFVSPGLDLEFSALALSFSLMFALFVLLGLLAPIQHWIQMCKSDDQDEQYVIKSVYINIDEPSSQYDSQNYIQNQPIIKRLSLRQKWKSIWKDEKSQKIYAFSVFRIVALPLIVYGQLFFQGNQAAFNYLAFQQEIYEQIFSKIAMLSYYVPDIFFMISGFLFCKKILEINDRDKQMYVEVLKAVLLRITRLYPIYLTVFLIYWCITPALHCGPVWYVYQEQATICETAWWRVFLMIDNWWTESCYPILWFVQVQVQFTLFISIFFLIYFTNSQVSYYYFGLIFLTSWILIFVLSAQLPATLEIIMQDYSSLYFRSFYSHLGFYLWGTFLALLANNTSLRVSIQQKVLQNHTIMTAIILFTTGLLSLIFFLPSIWIGTPLSMSMELALCRLGIAIAFTLIFLNGIFRQNRQIHSSVLHKYGYYVYPIILCTYLVMQGSFWSVSSFFYIDAINLINNSIPILIVSGATGLFIGLMMDVRGLIVSNQ